MTNEIITVEAVEAVETIDANVELNGSLSLTFNFPSAGIIEQIPLGSLPESSIIALLQYGTRKGNDFVNSAFKAESDKGGSKSRQEFVAEWLEKLKAGTLGTRSSVQSEEAKAWREFVASQAKRVGIQAKAIKGLDASEIISLMVAKHPEKRDEVVAKLENVFEAIQEASRLDFDI